MTTLLNSCWLELAAGILQRHSDRSPENAESVARRAVQAALFLEMCRQRSLLPSDLWHAASSGGRFSGAIRHATHALGQSLFDADEAVFCPIDPLLLDRIVAHVSTGPLTVEINQAPAELLGQIHQRLLGRRLHQAASGQWKARATTATRKVSGVFYTPAWVTQYIVEQTIGGTSLSAAKGVVFASTTPFVPQSVPPGQMTILDPACGCGWFLLAACRRLLAAGNRPAQIAQQLYGIDIDAEAALAARRTVWLELAAKTSPGLLPPDVAGDLGRNICCGNVLADGNILPHPIFDLIVGNPPYRRELGAKALLDTVAATVLGKRYRTARMDLWYYFFHRGLELLKPGGRLSFIVGSYWTSGRGAANLIETLRRSVHLDEIVQVDDPRMFPGVSGRHMIVTVTNTPSTAPTRIRRVTGDCGSVAQASSLCLDGTGKMPVLLTPEAYTKTSEQLFRHGHIDLEPPCDMLLAKLDHWPPLRQLGAVRQGIAENPASITHKSNSRHGNRWMIGEGVFTLTPAELAALCLPERERELLRPYHDSCDVGRYWIAPEPSLAVIYSTAATWPELACYPVLAAHLERFRSLMEARRETRKRLRAWWHLHWPRDERLWQLAKIVALQMAARPSFVAVAGAAYVPFSTNVFVPAEGVGEDLRYIAALLNSRLLWTWYRHHAKRRGVGLEINGHVLAASPIRRIDFSNASDRAIHDRIVELATRMAELCSPAAAQSPSTAEARTAIDREIDENVEQIYGVSPQKSLGGTP